MSKKVEKKDNVSKAITKKELESITINQTGVQKILLDLGSLEAQKSEVIKEYEKYSVTLEQIKTKLLWVQGERKRPGAVEKTMKTIKHVVTCVNRCKMQ